MDAAPDIPRIASLLADPARAKMLWALIDGTTRPAGELAYAANVSAQSASAHLAKLVEGGLLVTEALGRHRYFRIRNAVVAELVESLASLSASASPRTPPDAPLAQAMPRQFLHARTCYDHLAGEIAVRIMAAMRQSGWLAEQPQGYGLTPLGGEKLQAMGVDVTAVQQERRLFARGCVDLTQRRLHLGGALGATLLTVYLAQCWVQRNPRSRVVHITPKGREAFRDMFGIAT